MGEDYHMNCKECGAQLFDDSKFCAVCGKPVISGSGDANNADQPVIGVSASQSVSSFTSQPVVIPVSSVPPTAASPVETNSAAAPAANKKSTKSKPVLIALIAVAALAVVAVGIIIAWNVFSGPGAVGSKAAMKPLLLISGEDETLIYTGENEPITIDGMKDSYAYSMDGKAVALTVDIDDEYLAALWYCDGKDAVDVAEDVYSFILSADGSKIAYLQDYAYEDSVGDLYVYDVSTKKSELIVKDAYTEFALSPDGESISYTTDVSMDDYGYLESFTGYVSINGDEAEEIGENLVAVAMANDGKYIYYVEIDTDNSEVGSLFIRHGDTDEKMGDIDLYSGIYLNRDCSDVLFVKNGSTYISVDAADREKVSDMEVSRALVPESMQYYQSYSQDIYSAIADVDSFAELLVAFTDYEDGGTVIAYLDKDYNGTDIDELDDYAYMYGITVSPDGKSLYYTNDSGKLLYYKDFRDLDADPVKLDSDEDVDTFVVMPDKTTIYYVDVEQTLWVQRGDKDPEEIADSVESYPLLVSQDGKGIYFIADFETADDADGYAGGGTLYYVKDSEDADPEELAEDVYTVKVSEYGTVYYVYDSYDEETYSMLTEAFFSLDGEKFESVMDNATIY